MDIKLDNTGDLDFTSNDFSYVTEYDAVIQHLRIRLRSFKGEWFLNTDEGMPYFQEFFVKNPSKLILDSRMREAILETPGIKSLTSLTYDFDGASRALSIDFTALLDDNTDFRFTFSELLIGD